MLKGSRACWRLCAAGPCEKRTGQRVLPTLWLQGLFGFPDVFVSSLGLIVGRDVAVILLRINTLRGTYERDFRRYKKGAKKMTFYDLGE